MARPGHLRHRGALLKAGIFLDVENLVRNGGWGMRYRTVRELAEAQGSTVIRANAYTTVDYEREAAEEEFRRKKRSYRAAIRREGYRLVSKRVHRYRDVEGETITKADVDLDLAVDTLLQSQNLDHILLGSGDGDFLRLVRALQNRGKRVDLLSFANTSSALREEVDFHFNGFLYPGILPADADEPDRRRGYMHHVVEEKGYGFLTIQTGLGFDDVRDDVFLHINDFAGENGHAVSNDRFARLRDRRTLIEFDLVRLDEGKVKAENAREFQAG